MEIELYPYTVNKRFALQIARGTSSQNHNLAVGITADNITGWGEAVPFSIGSQVQSFDRITTALQAFIPHLVAYHPLQRQSIESLMNKHQLPSAAMAAIDLALYDWLAKSVGLPLWKLWGLDRDKIVPISATVGINTPEGARARIRGWLEVFDARFLKIKLGNPLGIGADREMMLAVKDEMPDAKLTVDANGGWNLEDAIFMSQWLGDLGVEYLEQPLARGDEDRLIELKKASPLPIFADESCFTSRDIPSLVGRVDGINIKLMKAGGLTEAMRMIHTARAHGLQVMFGCYSDTVLANTAAAQLSPLADYLDLDSHLNLLDDPFIGAKLIDGKLIPGDLPGLGIDRMGR
ncbi:dipeptide epimerase [Chamaesiphon sp. VAR_48_metabat_135_sub]|uniref:dipeptide epimerase n=1 Tax=Chamaesiphon sp. VAR_48_metabat_135_sub TaxID=2964699 RepID=UPI00286C2C09|nr:dipeptide epimerase [Chamaesiphon sp. VAR_48_metabat_135_sub]